MTLIFQVCYNTMPIAQPTNDYLKWCNSTYKDSEDTDNLVNNLRYTSKKPWGLDSNWVEEYVDGWPHGFNTTGGILNSISKHTLTTQPLAGVRTILNTLHTVVQPPLKTKSAATATVTAEGVDNRWRLFSGEFSWLQQDDTHPGLCIPYQKALVQQQPPCHMYMHDKGYLKVVVGYDDANNIVFDYAHRLVCMAFHGGPMLEGDKEFDWSLVVHHKCRNTTCLNPRHLEWLTAHDNMEYKGVAVGHVPE